MDRYLLVLFPYIISREQISESLWACCSIKTVHCNGKKFITNNITRYEGLLNSQQPKVQYHTSSEDSIKASGSRKTQKSAIRKREVECSGVELALLEEFWKHEDDRPISWELVQQKSYFVALTA